MMRFRLLCVVMAFAVLALHGGGASMSAAQSTPTRIISIVPAVTEMLFAVGAGPRVVGVSSFETYPPEAMTRTKVGALVDPDFERILSLRPDLVIAYGSQTELLDRLNRLNVPVYVYRHSGLADITSTIRELGVRIGLRENADRLAREIETGLEDVRRSVAGRQRPRTALLFGREPGTLRSVYASAGIGFMHDLLELSGGLDVFADVKRESLQVSTEILLQRAPELILEVHPAAGWTPERIQRELQVWRQLPAIPAVRNGRIHIIADDRLIIPGPRVVESARMIAEIVRR